MIPFSVIEWPPWRVRWQTTKRRTSRGDYLKSLQCPICQKRFELFLLTAYMLSTRTASIFCLLFRWCPRLLRLLKRKEPNRLAVYAWQEWPLVPNGWKVCSIPCWDMFKGLKNSKNRKRKLRKLLRLARQQKSNICLRHLLYWGIPAYRRMCLSGKMRIHVCPIYHYPSYRMSLSLPGCSSVLTALILERLAL